MPDQAISVALPSDHLTRKLLRRSQGLSGTPLEALLEQLCTESVYSLKDDFDHGINDHLWVTRNMALADHDPFGILYGTSPEDDPHRAGGDYLVRSRLATFFPNRRAVVQVRAQVSGDGSHAEIGFVGDDTSDEAAAATLDASGVIQRGAESFGLALRCPTVNGWSVVSGGSSAATRTAVTTQVAERGWATFLVSLNEQGETRLWINGRHNNEVARQTSMRVNLGHFLWLHVFRGLLSVDYIQAWQERTPL